MHRFFVPPELLKTIKSEIVLPKDLAHQVRDVLRLHSGEQIILLDNSGEEILATVAKSSKTSVAVYLHERRHGKCEPTVRIILCQGLLKSARFEWILEKGTELGVSVFSPMTCGRSSAGLEDAGTTKIQRWRRIIQEAAEQSGRSHLPELLDIRPLTHALKDIPPKALAIMPWEEEHAHTLHDVLSATTHYTGNVGATLAVARPTPDTSATRPTPDITNASATRNVGATLAVARSTSQTQPISPTPFQSTQNPSISIPQSHTTVVLFIGPEGGLMPEEIALAQQCGVQVVTLGSRVLRAETAALVTVANVIYEFDR